MIRTYEELSRLLSFEQRFHYLSLKGLPFDQTFGSERFLNQRFYNSYEWRQIRNYVIARDFGRDLGVEGREIYRSPYIHHINPITPEDLKMRNPMLLDPNNLITVSHQTHNAIHYGDESHLLKDFVERRPGDTKEW